ncbi:MAG TPA: universal stress protein, partial [Caldithrix abyssi]|nr:universal stress protein [Caldithrix abyssi]
MIKSILLPIDGSPYAEAVLQYGKYLAENLDAALHVLTVVDIRLYEWNLAAGTDSFVPVIPSTEFQEESQRVQEERAEQILKKAEQILKPTGLSYDLNKRSGIPVDEICQLARTNDLVIMGVRGEYERWRNKMLGATVEAVTRQITTSTLLVDKTFQPFETIICGYDGSSFAIKALQISAYLASAMKKGLNVITVSDDPDEGKEVLDEAARYLQPYKTPFKLILEKGDVTEEIIALRKSIDKPSLIIIGSYGHSRLREAILGSITVEVMRKAEKPIIL